MILLSRISLLEREFKVDIDLLAIIIVFRICFSQLFRCESECLNGLFSFLAYCIPLSFQRAQFWSCSLLIQWRISIKELSYIRDQTRSLSRGSHRDLLHYLDLILI